MRVAEGLQTKVDHVRDGDRAHGLNPLRVAEGRQTRRRTSAISAGKKRLNPHIFVFCYDVARDRTRRRMAELLEGRGTRVQKSVFEVRCTIEKAERLLARLAAERGAGDSVRMYCLTEEARARSRAAGGAPIPERSEYWLL